jgi:hypothetical protein
LKFWWLHLVKAALWAGASKVPLKTNTCTPWCLAHLDLAFEI